jgi:hypothetical protein
MLHYGDLAWLRRNQRFGISPAKTQRPQRKLLSELGALRALAGGISESEMFCVVIRFTPGAQIFKQSSTEIRIFLIKTVLLGDLCVSAVRYPDFYALQRHGVHRVKFRNSNFRNSKFFDSVFFAIFVVRPDLKRIERLEHLELLELAQRGSSSL